MKPDSTDIQPIDGRVTDTMIAKDLRWMGKILKPLMNSLSPITFKKSKYYNTVDKKEPKELGKFNALTDKHKYSVYIQRPDSSYLRLLIMKPEKKNKMRKLPGVLWIHGGGYGIGAPENSKANNLIKTNECVIVAPAYTKSVDKPYPAALDDCYLALLWMKEHTEELGIKQDQLCVGGESAGGGLTVALSLLARDKGEVNIAFQMPLYPMLDDRMNTTSMKNNNAPVWNEQINARAWKLYLNGYETISKYAAPARESDFSNLPPALTFVGDLDPFYDETRIYVEKLKQQNIEVTFQSYKGAYHGFEIIVPWSKTAKEAEQFFIDNFLLACRKYTAPQHQK